MTSLQRALADVARINAFFSLSTVSDTAQWQRLATLWEDLATVDAEVTAVRDRFCARLTCTIDDVEWRVAASVFAQGLASRLLSPQLALAVCHGAVVDPTTLWWCHPRSGSLTLALGPASTVVSVGPSTAERIAAALRHHVLDAVLAPTFATLRERGNISVRLLWGNAASSLAGAARAVAQSRPEQAPVVGAVTRQLLDGEPFRGLSAPTADPLSDFVRRSCCLYYRLPGAGMCGDCCLRRSPARPARTHRS